MTSTVPLRRLEAQIMVDHPVLLSEDLENLLALPPDERWDVGQSYRTSPNSPELRYRFSRWAIGVATDSIANLTDAIGVLTKRIQGMEDNFRMLPSGSIVSLTLFVTEPDSVIGFGMEAEAVRLLARINAGIEVSLVVASPGGPESGEDGVRS